MAVRSTPHAHVPAPRDGVRPIGFAHVVLRTAQLDTMVAWYCNVLGAQPVLSHPMITFITWDHSQDRVAFLPLRAGNAATRGTIGLDHVCFELASLADLAATYRRLQSGDLLPYMCANHGVASSLYYRDPDDNQIELSVSHFDTADAVNEWLASGDFDENPAGVILDAEEFVHQIESNADESTLLRPHPRHRTWLAEQQAARRG